VERKNLAWLATSSWQNLPLLWARLPWRLNTNTSSHRFPSDNDQARMSEPVPKRRQKYSRLICLRCRARRIRCNLPDSSIQPSPQPQPDETKCERCRLNNLDCVVDSTTLGRPAQKRKESTATATATEGYAEEFIIGARHAEATTTAGDQLEDFLLLHPENVNGTATAVKILTHVRDTKLSKSELSETLITPYQLFTAMLSKDKHFASALRPPPQSHTSVVDFTNDMMLQICDQG
jgi:hypothetical protein